MDQQDQPGLEPIQTAKPGPHPHEMDRADQTGGANTELPEGVEAGAWQDQDDEPHQEVRPWV